MKSGKMSYRFFNRIVPTPSVYRSVKLEKTLQKVTECELVDSELSSDGTAEGQKMDDGIAGPASSEESINLSEATATNPSAQSELLSIEKTKKKHSDQSSVSEGISSAKKKSKPGLTISSNKTANGQKRDDDNTGPASSEASIHESEIPAATAEKKKRKRNDNSTLCDETSPAKKKTKATPQPPPQSVNYDDDDDEEDEDLTDILSSLYVQMSAKTKAIGRKNPSGQLSESDDCSLNESVVSQTKSATKGAKMNKNVTPATKKKLNAEVRDSIVKKLLSSIAKVGQQ